MPETAWKCDKCGQIYGTEDLAQSCEEAHVPTSSMVLRDVEYGDGGNLPKSLLFLVDPEYVEGDEDVYVRYVFESAGPVGI